MSSILTVEDNVETQILLKHALEGHHDVYASYDLASARNYIKTKKIDLIILDLILPDGYGMDLFRELCSDGQVSKIPMIILSSQIDIDSRVLGLQSGADDYIIKPFIKQELLARVDSVLRRGPTRHSESTFVVSDVSLDLSKQAAYKIINQQAVDLLLTPIEFKILLYMSRKFESEISRNEIRTSIWGATFISERNVDTHISKLRKKMKDTNLQINNKRGQGYILHAAGSQKSKKADSVSTQIYQLPAFGINCKQLYVQ